MAARMRFADSRRISSHSSDEQWATAAVQEERTTTRSWGIFSPTCVNQSMAVSSFNATIVEGCTNTSGRRGRRIGLNRKATRGKDVGQLRFALADLLDVSGGDHQPGDGGE